MRAIATVRSKVIPLDRSDIDTDLIIPAQYLTGISRDGYGEGLFRRLRDHDPEFPLNLTRYHGAEILLANANFGCGSSREHAVWALQSWGIRVVIAKSFADIFSANSAKNGLLLVTLAARTVDRLLAEAKDGLTLMVDLSAQTVIESTGQTVSFSYDGFRKHCLLHGLDDLEYLHAARNEIERFRHTQKEHTFFKTTNPNR